ncbi:MAG: tetracycline resistance MFS efflux pump [Marinosulfonomonas sp.]|nr:MAG: tetracycline resistance MFS efflux pump [Marinosulfonomonas sp.]
MTSRLPVIFILITVVIDAMGIGLIMPVMPGLIKEVQSVSLGQAALWGGVLATSFAVMQFIFGPILGNLSDRYGRRPVLLASLFVMTLDYLVMAVAGTIWLLFLGRLVGGVASATQSTASAAMADISEPDKKAANFGLVGAAFGIGFVFGPLMGGLLGGYGTRAPFYAAAALAGANLIFGYFAMPETVTDRIRRPFEWRRANPFGAFKHIGQLPGLKGLMITVFISAVAFFVYPAIWAYYGEARFGWGSEMIGLSLAAFGLSIAIVQGVLIRPILRVLGERNTVILGLSIDVFAFILLGFITNGTMALLLTPLTALGSIAGPALQGIMSRTANDDQQGELQGMLTSINAVAIIIAPLLMTQIFWYFTSAGAPFILPGAPFLLSAVLTLICIGIFVATRHKQAKP